MPSALRPVALTAALAVAGQLATGCSTSDSASSTTTVATTTTASDATPPSTAPLAETTTTTTTTATTAAPPTTSEPPADDGPNRVTREGVRIGFGRDDSDGVPSLAVRAAGPSGGSTAVYVPLELDTSDVISLLGWAGDGSTALFVLSTTPDVAGVRLERDGETIDEVAPDEDGLASLAGTGQADQFRLTVLDAGGATMATCGRSPKFATLYVCDES